MDFQDSLEFRWGIFFSFLRFLAISDVSEYWDVINLCLRATGRYSNCQIHDVFVDYQTLSKITWFWRRWTAKRTAVFAPLGHLSRSSEKLNENFVGKTAPHVITCCCVLLRHYFQSNLGIPNRSRLETQDGVDVSQFQSQHQPGCYVEEERKRERGGACVCQFAEWLEPWCIFLFRCWRDFEFASRHKRARIRTVRNLPSVFPNRASGCDTTLQIKPWVLICSRKVSHLLGLAIY